jgi:hypothetical protein
MNNELKEEIFEFLKTKINSVHFKDASSKTALPYCIFNLTNSSIIVNNREDYILEITLWDKNADTNIIDNIRDSINGDGDIFNPSGLDRKTFFLDNNIGKCYKEGQLDIIDQEKNIERRQINYIIKLF